LFRFAVKGLPSSGGREIHWALSVLGAGRLWPFGSVFDTISRIFHIKSRLHNRIGRRGANIFCFTTGKGFVFGCRPVPSIKLATNTPLYRRTHEDMDINCGVLADGEASMDELGWNIFQRILEVASGARTKSESLNSGNDEFVPWHIGAIM